MKKIKKLLKILGPGFITGASDDDPSGIAAYSQTGAQFGLAQIWTALFTTPFMIAIQETCGRIGLVTGKGLAGVIRKHYPRPLLYTIVLALSIANIVNIGADLGAMAEVIRIVFKIPFIFGLLIIAVITIVLEVVVSYRLYSGYLKYLTLSLLAYVATILITKQDWGLILKSVVIPQFVLEKGYVLNLIAIMGTTISPYLFFWQVDQEVEEEVAQHEIRAFGLGTPKIKPGEIRKMRLDTMIGMIFSNLVMFAIMVTAAGTLYTAGIHSVDSADQAAQALRPLAGDLAFFLFALGIIGTGLLAIPILAASASYAVSECFRWKEGLSRSFSQAEQFYLIIIVATAIGFLINLSPIKPFTMLYYSAIINGIIAPPLILVIMLIGNNKYIMGKHTNGILSNIFGFTIAFLMFLAAVFLLV